ncbi:THO complex subunit 1 transcription elongation factor-domain-containing protein [Mycotypha africana]|uniref:THO complex subunit 1 transcription elongation factor-domain-containing protein n=1 Tax=Mycotypha africana TaxID=64632 RepID=UPI002300D90B|nr:THO complex subunit 1 transcription elongation factor-domain-containing protein [Mycotypha africana]KAI8991913.1 THO complex subunit 1 transcription elongation factor-domain-containing protein [Mycotypha africana]
MSKFLIYQEEAENVIQDCLKQTESHRRENNITDVPTSFVKQLVENQILIIGLNDERIGLPPPEKGKADWRRTAIELVFRKTLLDIVKKFEENEERYGRMFDCLDIITYCAEETYLLDNVVPLTMIEELAEVHTTVGCEKIFNYIESRKDMITKGMVPGKGKGLILLRMCNELLRRLSKETNTVFCGRIMMFVANSFPLAERSGVNLRGDFNTNMVPYDDNEQVDSDPNMTDDQKEFYKLFWSTRVYFANPPSIFTNHNFEQLQAGTDKIIERFKIIAENEAEISGARKSEGGQAIGSKRDRTDYESDNTVQQMEEDPQLAEEMLAMINRDYQFPRLLSSRKLLGLELEDVKFRRNVIVQYLILFQYLSGFSEKEKEKTKEALAEIQARGGTTKQSLIQPVYNLKDEQIKWIRETRESFLTLLRATKPHGNLYTDIILTILKNETHWIIWKAAGCPPFEKKPTDMQTLEINLRKKKVRLEANPINFRYTHGSPEVSKLYTKDNLSLADFMKNRRQFPSAIDVIDKALAELDDSLDPSKERFNYANGALLHAARLTYPRHPTLIRQIYNAKKEVYKGLYSKLQEEVKQQEEQREEGEATDDQKLPVSSLSDFMVGNDEAITEDHHLLIILLLSILSLFIGPSASRQITVDNRCHHAIHVGYQTNGAGDPQILPSLKPGEAINLQFKPDWSGRVWARPPCDKGDECTRVASAKDPASLAEFNFFDNNNQVSVAAGIDTDYYDVSFVDGFNLPIRVEPVVDSKFRNGYYCTRTECTELPSCPEDLQVLDSQGRIVGCESACSKYGTEQYCCTGDFGTAETCLNSVNPFATVVEQQCPNVYSFAYDDATSMYTCNQALLYQVTFCPDS